MAIRKGTENEGQLEVLVSPVKNGNGKDGNRRGVGGGKARSRSLEMILFSDTSREVYTTGI